MTTLALTMLPALSKLFFLSMGLVGGSLIGYIVGRHTEFDPFSFLRNKSEE